VKSEKKKVYHGNHREESYTPNSGYKDEESSRNCLWGEVTITNSGDSDKTEIAHCLYTYIFIKGAQIIRYIYILKVVMN
jgi:hypothetical protein